MKHKHKKQWLSILLSVVMLFTGIIIPSTATAEPSNEITQNLGDTPLDNTAAPVQTELSETIISSDKVTFEEDKNLFSKTKQNEDGTYTMEVFDVPVKYLDATGKIKEKSLELKDTTAGYVTRQSDITCMFPKDISAGISLTYGDTVVTMVPDIAKSVVKTQHKDGVVSYLTDGKTLYQYSLTYMGYKEDIIVPDYTGQTEYHFTYYTNGLHMAVVDGELVFVDQDGKAVVGLSEVIVFTADDRNNTFGEYRCETIKANEEYRVTIVLDAEYLKDEKTTYPIVIDPGLELIINYDTGASAIEDATINSTAGTSPNGTSIFVGKRSTKGIARLLVRFPNIDLSAISDEKCILNATYVLRDLMCYSTPLDIEAHVFKSVWSESNVTWASTQPDNYVSTIMDTQTVFYRNGSYNPNNSSYTNSYGFNITSAVRGWKKGTYNPECGFILKATNAVENGDTNISVCFASFERSSNKPRLIIEYLDDTPDLLDNNIVIEEIGGTYDLRYSLPSDTSITFTSSNTSVATVSATGRVTAVNYGLTYISANFLVDNVSVYTEMCVVFVGQEYYIVFFSDGKMLSYSGLMLSCSQYQPNSHLISWIRIPAGSTSQFYLLSRYTPGGALAAVSSGYVQINGFNSADTNQIWKLKPSGGQIGLSSCSNDASLSGKVLYHNGPSISLVSLTSEYTRIGAIKVSNYFVPVTSVTLNDISVTNENASITITPNCLPANATYDDGTEFFTYTSSNPAVATFDQTTRDKLLIMGTGTTTITVTHRIYGISDTATVTVTQCPEVVVPCLYGSAPSYAQVISFDVYLNNYLSEYSTLLQGATWNVIENGVMSFNPQNMTVKGLASGMGWLEARKNNQTVLVCYVTVDDIFKTFDPSVKDYLYLNGTFLGTMSCYQYEQDYKLDPLLLRTEWYLYAVNRANNNVPDEEIRQELNEKFGLNIQGDMLFQPFMSEVLLGSRGRYTRENLTVSIDGAIFLLDYVWYRFAEYALATLDLVNIYTPATQQDILDEEAVARNMCRETKHTIQEVLQNFTHNGSASSAVIGTKTENVSWFSVGEQLGSSYFYSEYYDDIFATNPYAVKAANNQFITDALKLNKTIYCSHNPSDTLQYFASSSFAEELRLIEAYFAKLGKTVSYTEMTINGCRVWKLIVS